MQSLSVPSDHRMDCWRFGFSFFVFTHSWTVPSEAKLYCSCQLRMSRTWYQNFPHLRTVLWFYLPPKKSLSSQNLKRSGIPFVRKKQAASIGWSIMKYPKLKKKMALSHVPLIVKAACPSRNKQNICVSRKISLLHSLRRNMQENLHACYQLAGKREKSLLIQNSTRSD